MEDFIVRDWLRQEPSENEIATLASEGGKYLPIEVVEDLLDNFNSWSTQNFKWQIFKDGYSNNCVAASIEVVIEYMSGESVIPVRRVLTGGCNFSINSLFPNTHFIATAKSECVKNAMSDIGKRFGRGLNKWIVPDKEKATEATGGITLHDGLEQYRRRGDVTEV